MRVGQRSALVDISTDKQMAKRRCGETLKTAVSQAVIGILIVLVSITAYHRFVYSEGFVLELNTLLWMIGGVLAIRVLPEWRKLRRRGH